MIADNSKKWSFSTGDLAHFWTTGNDYEFSIDTNEGTVTFDSDTAKDVEISLALAQDFAEMFQDLFGVDLTLYSTTVTDGADETVTEDV